MILQPCISGHARKLEFVIVPEERGNYTQYFGEEIQEYAYVFKIDESDPNKDLLFADTTSDYKPVVAYGIYPTPSFMYEGNEEKAFVYAGKARRSTDFSTNTYGGVKATYSNRIDCGLLIANVKYILTVYVL